MEQDITPFDRPIPNQSLTGEPERPWENPAPMSEIEDVTKFYIERLANQEVKTILRCCVNQVYLNLSYQVS